MNRIRAIATAALLCVLLPACQEKPEDAALPATAGSPTARVPAPVSADTLRAKAEQAMRQQRLFAPAGNNALEYFLALKRQQPRDAGVQAGLVDLQPLLVIAIEQAIARGALPEGQRLLGHLKEMDADAPALGRLQGTLADAQRLALARVQATDEDARAKAEANAIALRQQAEANAQRLTPAQATPATPPTVSQAPVTAAIAATPEAPAPSTRPPAPTPAQTRPEPVANTPAPLPPEPTRTAPAQAPRQVHVVAPVYPPAERSRGLSGEVQVGFTIGADGRVEESRVVASTLPNVFGRAALSAVSRWKFEASGSRHASQRTLVFSPVGG